MNETKEALVKQLMGNAEEAIQKMRTLLVESIDVVREVMPPEMKASFLADVDTTVQKTTDMVVELYCESFSEEELHSLVKWTNDPAVRKADSLLPRIHERAIHFGVEMARRSIEKYAAQMQEIIKARKAAAEEIEAAVPASMRTPKTLLN